MMIQSVNVRKRKQTYNKLWNRQTPTKQIQTVIDVEMLKKMSPISKTTEKINRTLAVD